MKYHPDKNPDNEDAMVKFHDINEAYEVLQDDEQRKIYDQHGEEGLKNQGNQGGGFRFVWLLPTCTPTYPLNRGRTTKIEADPLK